jgi:hypothetical protein
MTRQIPELLEHAGFQVDALNTYNMKGEPRVFGYTYEGVARKNRIPRWSSR